VKKALLLTSILALIFFSCSQKKGELKLNGLKVQAPFEMPVVNVPDFSTCPKFSITGFGAVQGDQQKNSEAIKIAIDKANQAGGGIVVIPEGEWLTGNIHLKSNVNLHLDKGAVLLFSGNPDDYLPPVHSSWEGMECMNYSPLVYAYQCQNVAITGEGKLKAKMDTWKVWFTRPPAHMNSLKRLYNLAATNVPVEDRQMVNDSAHFRPQFIQFNRCENVLMDGISISNSPFWTIHLYHSKDLVLRNLHVYAHGHNNDGVDPEMSQNVLIENCTFDQGDDAIAIKSGRNQDGWRLNAPSKNIVIKHVTVKNGHQLVAIGSELSGGVEKVFIDSCQVLDGAHMFNLLFIKTNERRGGYVDGIYMSNITAGKVEDGILGIETDVLYQWKDLVPTVERKLTPIKNIYLTNVKATNVAYVSQIKGQKELPVMNVILKNVSADTIQNPNPVHENVFNFVEGK